MSIFIVTGCPFRNPKDTHEVEIEAPNAVTAMHQFERENFGWIAVEANIKPEGTHAGREDIPS